MTIDFLKTTALILTIIALLVIVFYFILDMIILKKTSSKYLNMKEEKKLMDKFNELLAKVTEQSSCEILECLLELEELDKIYEQIIDKKLSFIDEIEYLKIKEDKLKDVINEKISNVKPDRNKKENLRRILDEIRTCKKRYPKYNKVFVKCTNRIKKKLK